eukprot:TRINITY_DN215_c0_g1_i2.p1 TRINITY_DN215_c0_g1~~TRINITY_DN215_c0_g1_i2.p1  ORF type:complete len:186 (-),score=45.78 TRINITY_DN215_c0_g1_i2:1111-1668(-)
MEDDNSDNSGANEKKLLTVVYCGVCSLPPEFCEYGSSADKCKEWAEKNLNNEKGVSLVEKGVGNLELEKPKAAPKQEEVKMLPGGKVKRKEQPTILVTRQQRNKRKWVTIVSGLENFGVKLQDAAKIFAKKFSCGSSVVKVAQGEQIDVQGDVQDEIIDIIMEKYNVPAEAFFIIEEGKKVRARD